MTLLSHLEFQPLEGFDEVLANETDSHDDDIIDLSQDTPGEELVARLGEMVLDFQMDLLNDSGSQ